MKKRKLIIVSISIFSILLCIIFLYKRPGINNKNLIEQTEYNTGTEENTMITDMEDNNQVEEELPETKQYIASYDDLINSKRVSNKKELEQQDNDVASIDAITSEDNINTEQEVTLPLDENKVVIIDESEKNMIDESIVNEYKGNEQTSKEFQFFDVEPSGKDINGDVKANGVQVGNWN